MALLTTFLFVTSLAIIFGAPTPECPTLKVYVGTKNGGLIISEDGGQTWSRRDPSPASINAIWAMDKTVFVGTGSGLAVSKNGGHTWTMQYFRKDSNRQINSISGLGNRVVLAGYGNVTISEDLGQTWTVRACQRSDYSLQGVYLTEKKIFVGLGSGGLGISDDGGVSWRIVSADTPLSNSILAISGSGSDVYVQLSRKGFAAIAISNDGGESWGIQDTTTVATADGSPNNIVVDGNTVLVATTAGLAMSSDVWNHWDLKTTLDGLASNDTIVAASHGDNIFAGTANGLSISRDHGKTWTNPATPLNTQSITAIFAHCTN